MNAKDLQTFVKIHDLKLKAKINANKARRNSRRASELESKSMFASDGDDIFGSGRQDYYDHFWVNGRPIGKDSELTELEFFDEPWK